MERYRMYSLVLRHLSPVQKGIQSAHSVIEYASKFHKRSEFIHWTNIDKTMIILDGGTYQDMKSARAFLNDLGVTYSVFYEEDLNGLMTSISFIASDKIWDREKYPSYDDFLLTDECSSDSDSVQWLIDMGGIKNLKMRSFIYGKKLAC